MDYELETWNVIDLFFKNNDNYLTKHHLDSFNDFITNKLPQTFKQYNPQILYKELISSDNYKYEINIYYGGKEGNKIYIGKPIIYKEEELNSADGKIIRGKSRTLIKVNSHIKYTERKRFVAAHELGHFFLHDKLELHNDNSKTLNWFNLEEKAKRGIQEYEANDFASELLMPEKKFRSFIEKRKPNWTPKN